MKWPRSNVKMTKLDYAVIVMLLSLCAFLIVGIWAR